MRPWIRRNSSNQQSRKVLDTPFVHFSLLHIARCNKQTRRHRQLCSIVYMVNASCVVMQSVSGRHPRHHRTSLCTLTPPDVSDVPDVTGCSGRMSDAPDAATHVNIQNPPDASDADPDAHRTYRTHRTQENGRSPDAQPDAHQTHTGRHRTSPDVPDVPDAQGSGRAPGSGKGLSGI